jgi:hypothetical protein
MVAWSTFTGNMGVYFLDILPPTTSTKHKSLRLPVIFSNPILRKIKQQIERAQT